MVKAVYWTLSSSNYFSNLDLEVSQSILFSLNLLSFSYSSDFACFSYFLRETISLELSLEDSRSSWLSRTTFFSLFFKVLTYDSVSDSLIFDYFNSF